MKLRRIGEDIQIAARNFTRFRLQSALVVLAAALGVSGVLVSSGYAAGGERKILDEFLRLGTNVISISPLQSRAVGGRARTGSVVQTLTEADYRALKTNINDIDASSGMVSASFRVRAGDLTKTATIVGVEPAYFRMKSWAATRGALFDASATRRLERVAVLGSMVATDLFGAADPTGAKLTINRVPFVVGGVLAERGQSLDAANEDDQIYVPLPTAMHRLMNVDFYGSILLEVGHGTSMSAALAAITTLLHQRHRRISPISDDFQVLNQSGLIQAQLAAFARLSFLIRWIALSALAVSGLGILGLTWIGIRGRMREIGARRAIGATRADVLIQFLAESMVGSVVGCAVSVPLANFATEWLDASVGQPFVFRSLDAIWYVVGALVFFVIFVGFAAGRAALLDPIAALRTE